MKRFIAGIAVLTLFSSCGNKKANIDPFAAITKEIDSVLYRADTLKKEKKSEALKPIVADESFDDFIYNFASDATLQLQRVQFPLPYYNGDVASKIEEKYWKYDALFTNQSFYTLLFDREEEMDLVVNHDLTSVQVEWIYIPKRMIKKYCFERVRGAWMLQSIQLNAIGKKEREDFLEFYDRFASDSLYQSRRIRQPLQFVTTDPDDDFSILETTLDLNQWFAFKPTLPTDKLSNINYGQQNDTQSASKILALKGVGNGFSNILYFMRKSNGEWELYKFEDTSI